MKLQETTKTTVRVIAQLTFSKNRISLIAEESVGNITKGDVIKTITRPTLAKMQRPLTCEIINGVARPVVLSPA